MSIAFLESLLPLSEPHTEGVETPLQNLSEHDIGVLLSRFERFSDSITPYRAKMQPIESFLNSFSSEIHQLSETLLSLQHQSSQLSTDLDVQRNVVDKLNPVILDLMIPPSVAESVLSEPVDAKWVENIRFITEKQQLADKVKTSDDTNLFFAAYKDTEAFKELEKGLNSLEAKAVERIRDFMISQIRLLRRSLKTSSQSVQEKLLQVKEVFAFLKERHLDLANQLQLAYIYTMKWYYTTRFAKYLYALQKLRLKHVDLLYVLGGSNEHEDKLGLFRGLMEASYTQTSSPGTGLLGGSSRPSLSEYFLSVAKRMAITSGEDVDGRRSIPSQIAETTPFAYWLEFSYNQWANALLDNVIVEYLFFVDFFHQGNERFDPVKSLDPASAPENSQDWSRTMFGEIFKLGQDFVHWLVSYLPSLGVRIASGSGASSAVSGGTCDGYGILLIVRLIQNQLYTLHNEFHVPVMDEYLNSLLLQLWPHFTKIVDLNCEAMKKNILGSSSYSHRASEMNQAPINVTQQFSQFIVGLLKLAFIHDHDKDKQALFQGEPICMSIVRLRNDFESALTKAGNHMFGTGKSKAVQKEIFLFNNYFLIVTILRNEFDVDLTNEFITEQIKHFELLCDAYKPKR